MAEADVTKDRKHVLRAPECQTVCQRDKSQMA